MLCRASFGVRGANVPAILRALVACGWFGIQTWIGGLALERCSPRVAGVGAAAARLATSSGSRSPSSGCVQVAIIVRGIEGIKRLGELVGAAAARRRRAAARWAASAAAGSGTILGESAGARPAHVPFWQLFPAALTANVGYWATLSLNIPDFTRYARSQRSQALGQALGLPATMTAFAFIGVAVTSATIVIFGEAIWDPVALIARIGSRR